MALKLDLNNEKSKKKWNVFFIILVSFPRIIELFILKQLSNYIEKSHGFVINIPPKENSFNNHT